MSTLLVDLKKPRHATRSDIPDLGGVLSQLLGQPFLFARLGYADELTLHFGTARLADHPRLRASGIHYGSHILSLCASAWMLKSTAASRLILEDISMNTVAHITQPIADDARALIVSGSLIPAGSPVVAVVPYDIEQIGSIGLRLEVADGSGIIIVPTIETEDEKAEAEGTPELADWELETPAGEARVGPGRAWVWEPTGVKPATRLIRPRKVAAKHPNILRAKSIVKKEGKKEARKEARKKARKAGWATLANEMEGSSSEVIKQLAATSKTGNLVPKKKISKPKK